VISPIGVASDWRATSRRSLCRDTRSVQDYRASSESITVTVVFMRKIFFDRKLVFTHQKGQISIGKVQCFSRDIGISQRG
jgi:Trm5-related predicted tRNA methylase